MPTKPKVIVPPRAEEGPDAKGRVWNITGKKPTGKLLRFERGMKAFMAQNDFVGGTLAIVKDGRLVFARAYLHAKPPFEPIKVESLFRVASFSKPITCVGIYQLFESGALKPKDKVLDILELGAAPGRLGHSRGRHTAEQVHAWPLLPQDRSRASSEPFGRLESWRGREPRGAHLAKRRRDRVSLRPQAAGPEHR